MPNNYIPKYFTLGLDLGVSSVGWSVVELDYDKQGHLFSNKRIVNLGSRVFSAGERPKDGGPLAESRRFARGGRRRLARRKFRLTELKKLLAQKGFIEGDSTLVTKNALAMNVYSLRAKALDTKLSDLELSKVILSLAKRRGYRSNSKSEEKKTNDGGKVMGAINQNNRRMDEGGFRTYGEMIANHPDFVNNKRSRGDKLIEKIDRKTLEVKLDLETNYIAVFRRELVKEEFEMILRKQKEFGNENLTDQLIDRLIQIAFRQKHYASGNLLKGLIGYCQFYNGKNGVEKIIRSPKNAFSFEKFRFWQEVNNLRIVEIGKRYGGRNVKDEEKDGLFEKAISKMTLTYGDMRKYLKLSDHEGFSKLNYLSGSKNKATNLYEKKSKEEIEKINFSKFDGYHNIRKYLKKFPADFELLKDESLYDKIAEIFSEYKEDNERIIRLHTLGFSEDAIDCLLENLNFEKFAHLSLRAITELLPYLERGMSYYEASKVIGFGDRVNTLGKYLPNFDFSTITNNVVKRSLSQARKVINAVIRAYGSPTFIHIEMLRELSKSHKERNEISKQNEENRKKNENVRDRLINEFGIISPKGVQIEKFLLWESQDGICLYSMQSLDLRSILTDDTYTQIDHIIPFSASMDDTRANKALVKTEENQKKKDRSPYMYFRDEGKDFHKFEEFVKSMDGKLGFKKVNNLLNTEELVFMLPEDFQARDLNDSKYVAKYLRNYIQDNLLMGDIPVEAERYKRRIFTYNGKFTSFFRKHYGLASKNREDSRHHAVDATILAISTYKQFLDFSTYMKMHESDPKRGMKINNPWGEGKANFSKDLDIRAYSDDPKTEYLRDPSFTELYKDMLNNIHPILVSRAQVRKIKGPAHADTIYSTKFLKSDGVVTLKKKLSKLKETDIPNIWGSDPALKKAIADRIADNGGRVEGAFYRPLFKPSKKGGHGTLIRSVKVLQNSSEDSGLRVRGGVSDHSKAIFTDLYKYETKGESRFFGIKNFVAGRETVKKNGVFTMRIFQNDYIKATFADGKCQEGYFVEKRSGDDAITLVPHNLSKNLNNKRGNLRFAKAVKIEKFYIDPLGNKFTNKNKPNGIQKHTDPESKTT